MPGDGPSRRSNLAGLAVMALAMFLYSAVDAIAKLLTADLHPLQIVWTRQTGLFLGVLVLLTVRGSGVLRTPRPGLQLLRGTMAGISAALFIFAVRYVPLADAVAVAFVAPFFVTVAGAVLLGEPVGPRRWAAVVLGFIGTLIVIRPGSGVMHPAVFLVVIAAALFAGRQILSRVLAVSDRTETTVAYTALTSFAVLTVPALLVWQTPGDARTVALLVVLAVLAAAAEISVIRALELALSVVVAPVQYSMILWGTLYGWLIFGDLPDGWTFVGAAVIVLTGLYMLNRERRAGLTPEPSRRPA